MRDLSEEVANIVHLNGGDIVGRTRLQKSLFLLDAQGIGLNLDYDYHNFGPFSWDAAEATDDAVALEYLGEEKRFGYHQVPYSIFRVKSTGGGKRHDDVLSEQRLQALQVMKEYSALELEVAATAVYLRDNGYAESYVEELAVRKPQKATPQRVKKALMLIEALGI